jgi:hypothetical protein
MKVFTCFFIFGIVLTIISSCSKDDNNVVDCTGVTPTYTNDIAPILNASCATSGCHSALFPASGINLSAYTAAKSASINGKVLKSIKHESGVAAMPPMGASKLSAANIRLIECWIKNGAPE